jgi:hypothetical protein
MDGAAPHPGRGCLERPDDGAAADVLRFRHFPDPRRDAPELAVGTAATRAVPELSRPAPRSLISSCSGRIVHILFVLTGALLVGERCPAETLLHAAAAIPRISIVAHESCVGRIDALLEQVGRNAGVEVIAVPDNTALWSWAQDRCLVCRDVSTGAPVVVHGMSAEAQDAARYATAAAHAESRYVATALRLEGGNILADGDVCLVGADLCEDNSAFLERFGAEIESRRATVVIGGEMPLPCHGPKRFAMYPGDLRWRESINGSLSRSGTRQPVFHLDMFMTLAGRGNDGRLRVLVGDPRAASALIGVPLPDGFPQQAFDEVAIALERRGLDVIRNPLPFVYFDDPDARMRQWFFASANNCWVERVEEGQSRVWLPQYGYGAWPELRATDEANAALWRALGFEVIPAGDFLPLADQLGALNCASKILARDLSPICSRG